MKAGLLAVAALLLAGCAHTPKPPADAVERAARWLHGRFDNAAQVRADPRFVAMTVRWTPIWPGRDDGRWFLVEQALTASAATPYRRRVHRLRGDGDGGVLSEVFLPPPGDGSLLPASYAPADLTPQPGCTVHLRPAAGGLRGATRGRDCASRFRGAAWSGAEVWLTADGFASWDRGFAADGTQVWGAVSGPYRFRRTGTR